MGIQRALCLDGTSTCYAFSPLHSDFQGNGFDIRAVLAPDGLWDQALLRSVVGRGGLTNGFAYNCTIGGVGGTPTIGGPPNGAVGAARIEISADGGPNSGGFFTPPVAVPASSAQPYAVRWVYRGTPLRAAIYYKAPTIADYYPSTPLEDCESDDDWELARQFDGTTFNMFASNDPVRVGSCAMPSSAVALDGKVWAVVIKNGELGPTVANPDFHAQPVGTTSFIDDAGKEWFLNGSAQICFEGQPSVGGFLRQKQRASEQDRLRAAHRNRHQ